MPENKKIDTNEEEVIQIPEKYIEKIDRIIDKDRSRYPTREEFIKNAVQIKLAELREIELD
jgi:preprotein translocase subunit Sss1